MRHLITLRKLKNIAFHNLKLLESRYYKKYKEFHMLDARALGLAAGIFWGLSLAVLTIVSLYTGYGANWLSILTEIYPGFNISWAGSLIGLFYGFVDGFFCLFIFGWLYNQLRR